MTTTLPTNPPAEPESLAQLIGDCHKMAPHWETKVGEKTAAVAPSRLHGITVPPASAHVVDGMAEYGD
jgi:hypothetical protein